MKPKAPKEDPADKAARLRERRLAELDRNRATQELATGLTGDVRGTYGTGVSLFGLSPRVTQPARTPSPYDVRSLLGRNSNQ